VVLWQINSSNQCLVLKDLHVLFVSYIQKLGDVINVGSGHGLAVVFLDQECWIEGGLLSVLMFCSVYDTICLPSAD